MYHSSMSCQYLRRTSTREGIKQGPGHEKVTYECDLKIRASKIFKGEICAAHSMVGLPSSIATNDCPVAENGGWIKCRFRKE